MIASCAPAGWAGTDEIATLPHNQATRQSKPKLTQSQDAKNAKHASSCVLKVDIDAPQEYVWGVLTNFSSYPEVFKRIQSCRVVKSEGKLDFTETYLKPHMFLNQPVQHAINDLGSGPNCLSWHATDGNFKLLEGRWELTPSRTGRGCTASYTLRVDASGCVPSPLVTWVMHGMQKEIITSLKSAAERAYDQNRVRTSKLPQQPNVPGSS
jgi:ribosome-associated toxin RatA of RatAB toxin-antitoxin module